MKGIASKLQKLGYTKLASQVKKVLSESLFINFRNRNQVILYVCELAGQISDGHWENAKPHDHWKNMSKATAKVGKPLGCVGFRPMRSYNFASRDLIEVVGDRMIEYVQIANTFPNLAPDQVRECEDVKSALEYAQRDGSDYWKRRLAMMMKFLGAKDEAELLKKVEKIESYNYSKSNLMKDLKDMSQIVNGTASDELPTAPTRTPAPRRAPSTTELVNPTKKDYAHEKMRLESMGIEKYLKRLMTKVTDGQKLATAVLLLDGSGYDDEALEVAKRMVQLGFIQKKADAFKLHLN